MNEGRRTKTAKRKHEGSHAARVFVDRFTRRDRLRGSTRPKGKKIGRSSDEDNIFVGRWSIGRKGRARGEARRCPISSDRDAGGVLVGIPRP